MLERSVLGKETELDDQFEITALMVGGPDPDEDTEIIEIDPFQVDDQPAPTFRASLMSSLFQNLFLNL